MLRKLLITIFFIALHASVWSSENKLANGVIDHSEYDTGTKTLKISGHTIIDQLAGSEPAFDVSVRGSNGKMEYLSIEKNKFTVSFSFENALPGGLSEMHLAATLANKKKI